MWNLKYDTNEFICKKGEQTHRYKEQIYGYQRGKVEVRDKLRVWY